MRTRSTLRPPPRVGRVGRRRALPVGWLAAGLFGVSLLLGACGGSEQGTSSAGGRGQTVVPEGTPVVLISIDTLRSDRLPAYGYDGVETPAIDGLRADSVLFEHAFAHSPLTLPSHTALLTGRLPPFNGVRDNMGYRFRPERSEGPGGGFYLPSAFHRAGYRTGAAVSAYVLRGETGLDHDFDLYEDRIAEHAGAGGESVQRPGEETLAAASDWLQQVAGEPFFFFFHIYEPHTPHTPPEPFASRYGDSYDGEVAAADQVIGHLLERLRALGVYDRAIVVLLSDHGEGLGEHGIEDHGLFVYREAIQVPLMIKLPGGQLAGASVGRAAQLIDVAPTLVSLLGLDGGDGLAGTSLLDLMDQTGEERAIYSETYYPWVHYGWSPLLSIIRYPDHLIQGPDPEVYDLAADPAETEDLADGDHRLYASLRRELLQFPRELERPEPEDAATRDRLASLGYLGSATGSGDGPLADPKAKLGVVDQIRTGFHAYLDGDLGRSAEIFGHLVEQEPGLADGWEMLGKSLLESGRPEEAVAAYRKLVEISGGAPEAALPMARALVQLGQDEEARQYAEIAARAEPEAHALLAQIALHGDDLDRAREQIDAAVDRLGPRPDLLALRAQLLLRGERYAQALEAVRAADAAGGETSSPVRGLDRIRGEALANLGRADEAAAAFRREIDAFPDELAAYSRLAVLYALAGDADRTQRTLQGMVEANPSPTAYAEAARTLRVLGDPASAERLLAYARTRWPNSPELVRDGSEPPKQRGTMRR